MTVLLIVPEPRESPGLPGQNDGNFLATERVLSFVVSHPGLLKRGFPHDIRGACQSEAPTGSSACPSEIRSHYSLGCY